LESPMSSFAVIDTRAKPNRAAAAALAQLLRDGVVDAVLAPAANVWSELPMPTLFTDPEALSARALPLAPAAAVSMATQSARASRGRAGHRLAAVLKPCELRAVIELAKLRQADLAGLALISMECRGRLENGAYLEEQADAPDFPERFLLERADHPRLCATCATCDSFVPVNADLTFHTLGLPLQERLALSWGGETGARLVRAMGLQESGEMIEGRESALAALMQRRREAKEALFSRTAEAMDSLGKLQQAIGSCLGCLNCRTACPVCYCRECICSREAFDRDAADLQARAAEQGAVRLPDNTTMFHLTRMVHMAHSCVGCGQCSSVCPSRIPVADLFRTAAAGVQEAFGYEPGRDIDAPIPYLDFEGEAER
jgi:formate dehydrogenase (coenzyme F420) beta subunit